MAGSNAAGKPRPAAMRRSQMRRGVQMAHRQRRQLAHRVLALVLVTLLFCIAVLAATYRLQP
jgi:hypothetical protein